MATATISADKVAAPVSDDGQTWYDLYTWLLPLVEGWVREARVLSWHGQYREIAEDIAHEAVMRTFRYSQRSQQGELAPIGSLKALGRVIARNYFRDWRKKDWCLIHPNQEYGAFDLSAFTYEGDASQIALDHLILHSLIVSIAQQVAKFPPGQRTAILTDLANISDFDDQPSLLEQALADVGLCLSDYQQPRSPDPLERGRYAALRSIAYKRLKHVMRM